MLRFELAEAERRCATIREYWIARGYYGIEAKPVIEQRPNRYVPGTTESAVVIKTNVGPQGFPPKR